MLLLSRWRSTKARLEVGLIRDARRKLMSCLWRMMMRQRMLQRGQIKGSHGIELKAILLRLWMLSRSWR